MGKRTYHVFVSYRSKDKDLASELATHLKQARLRVWLDAWEILGDERHGARIDRPARARQERAIPLPEKNGHPVLSNKSSSHLKRPHDGRS